MVVVLVVPRLFSHSYDVLSKAGGRTGVASNCTDARAFRSFLRRQEISGWQRRDNFTHTLKPDIHTMLMMNLLNHWCGAC